MFTSLSAHVSENKREGTRAGGHKLHFQWRHKERAESPSGSQHFSYWDQLLRYYNLSGTHTLHTRSDAIEQKVT